MGYRQQVKYRIGRSSHRDVQRHGIQECLTGGNAPGKYAFITVPIIFIGIFYNQFRSIFEQLGTVGMGRHNRSVSGKSQTDRFVQAVHRIGGKHSRTTSASGTGPILDLGDFFITHTFVGRLNHRINQVQMLSIQFTGFHRTSGYKYSRNIQSHSRHQHPRSDFVTIADTYHGIRFMGIHHIFHTIGNDIPGRKRIKHSVMSHGNTIINGNRIEFRSKASQLLNFFFHQLTYFM